MRQGRADPTGLRARTGITLCAESAHGVSARSPPRDALPGQRGQNSGPRHGWPPTRFRQDPKTVGYPTVCEGPNQAV